MLSLEFKRQCVSARSLGLAGGICALAALVAFRKYLAMVMGYEYLDGFRAIRGCLVAYMIVLPSIVGIVESSLAISVDWASGMIRTRCLANVARGEYILAKLWVSAVRQAAVCLLSMAPVLCLALSLGLRSSHVEDHLIVGAEMTARLFVLLSLPILCQECASALGLLMCLLCRGRSFLASFLSLLLLFLLPLFIFRGLMESGIARLMATGVLRNSAWVFSYGSLALLLCLGLGLLVANYQVFTRMDIFDTPAR